MKNFKDNKYGSAISFVIGMLVIGLVVAALVGTFAFQIQTASTDEAIAGGNLSNSTAGDGVAGGNDDVTYGGVPGGAALLGILALLFIVIPVVLFAKAAK